jgi:uncharacterized membrane protein YoaT (DUF817 family)
LIEVIQSSGEEMWRVDAYQIPYYSRGIEGEKQTHPRFADWGFQFILVSSFFQGSSLFRVPVYSGFLFILVVSYLFRVPVYSGFQFIQHFSLIRVPVKSGFLFILVFSLFRVPVYSGFQFILVSSLFSISVYSEFQLSLGSCLFWFPTY